MAAYRVVQQAQVHLGYEEDDQVGEGDGQAGDGEPGCMNKSPGFILAERGSARTSLRFEACFGCCLLVVIVFCFRVFFSTFAARSCCLSDRFPNPSLFCYQSSFMCMHLIFISLGRPLPAFSSTSYTSLLLSSTFGAGACYISLQASMKVGPRLLAVIKVYEYGYLPLSVRM